MTATTPPQNEKPISRHPPFKQVEQTRPDYDSTKSWNVTKTVLPEWKQGLGATSSEWKNFKKIAIDPNSETRSPVDNYKLFISAITPRPIGFVSTESKQGKRNLAPFSYFNVMNSDPPIFVLGFSGGKDKPKDSLRNILETEELTINIISEWFIEAANYCAVNSPYGVNEWELSGLTPLESSAVKPPQVAESAFSVEAKLVDTHEWKLKRDPSKASGVMCIVEGVRIHVREDLINEERNTVDTAKLKPVARLGGITYGRVNDVFELPRPDYEKDVEK